MCAVFSSEHQAGPVGEQNNRQVRGPDLQGRQSHCAGTGGIQECSCTWQPREHCVHTSSSALLSLPAWRTGIWLCVLVFDPGSVCRCCRRWHLVRDSLRPYQCPLCRCVCICGVDVQLSTQISKWECSLFIPQYGPLLLTSFKSTEMRENEGNYIEINLKPRK